MLWAVFFSLWCVSNCARVNVSFYYETLCEGCQELISTEYKTLYENKDVWNLVNLHMVPFGWAVINPDGTMTCQHGEEECLLNSYEGCVMDSVSWNQDLYMPFVLCLESNATKSRVVECMESANIDQQKVETCMAGTRKMEIARAFAAEMSSLLPQPNGVPGTFVNGEYVGDGQSSLVSTVCTNYVKQMKGKNVPDACKGAPIAVDFYFESLCPGCRQYLFDTLYPVFQELKGIMRLSLYPYGNAHINPNTGNITCQHGANECLYNQVEGCAIYHADYDADGYMEFIKCFEKNPGVDNNTIYTCASPNTSGDYYELIEDCMKGNSNDEKDLIELAFAEATASLFPPHKYTPWVVVNGVPTYDNMYYLKEVVCNAYTGTKPKTCDDVEHVSKPNAKMNLCFA